MAAKRTITIISTETFHRLSSCITDHELVQYDSIKYRSNPVEEQWEGKRIVALPNEALALVAQKGSDEKGDFILLFMFLPKPQAHVA